MAPSFTLAVGPSNGTRPTAEIVDFSSWTLDDNLDDGCSFSFSALGNSLSAQAIDELATDVWLYQDSVLLQRFRITNVDQVWGPDGEDEISIKSCCYRRLLQSRVAQTTLTFTAISQGVIVWDLISHTQAQTNGNLGITLVTTGPSVLRDRTYNPGTNIFSAIRDFTIIETPLAWSIDANLGLSIYDPATLPTIAQPIILGVNAVGMSRPSSASGFANAALAIGNNELIAPIAAEAAGLATDPRGRWERVVTISNEASATNLTEYADGLVQTFVSPASTWRVAFDPDRYFSEATYMPGDYVTVVQPRSTVYSVGVPAPSVAGQIISRSITGDANGQLSADVALIEVNS